MQHPSPSSFVRWWNLFARMQPEKPPMSVDRLLDTATRRSGLTDFGDTTFIEAMRVFIQSVEENGGLHAFGSFYLRQLIIAMLVHRLKLVELLSLHPKITHTPIEQPVFVLGLPRSGTTLLYNLLAQDPASRCMANWEAFISQVPPGGTYTLATDPRRKQAKWVLRVQKLLMPDLDKVHEFTPGGPEECTQILMQGFATQAMAGGFDVPEYSTWLTHVDHDPTYAHHKRVVQALHWKYPGERWLFKSPDHLAGMSSIDRFYPDARFIHIHRDPERSVSSWASLNYVYRQPYYSSIATDRLGIQVLERLSADMDRYLSERRLISADRFYDIQYSDLMGDPIEVLRDAYAHFGLDFTEETRANMQQFLSANPENKHGIHSYTPEDFGLNRTMIRNRFERYLDEFESASLNR